MLREAASLALINGEVYPFASPGRASAILARDGLIAAVGSDLEILKLCDTSTLVLDLRGATVLPGLALAGASFADGEEHVSGQQLADWLAGLTERGVTQVEVALAGSEGGAALLRKLAAERALPLRVKLRHGPADDDLGRDLDGRGMLAEGAIEIRLDGTLRKRTAALREDYSDEAGNRGTLLIAADELCEIITAANSSGQSIALHAFGDAAIESAVDAFARAIPVASERRRHRLVHCALGDEELYGRVAELGLSVEIRPQRLKEDWPLIVPRLGGTRARYAFAWKTLLRKRVNLCAGCEPEERVPSPLDGINYLTTRLDGNGAPREGWMPGEALDRSEAFWLYTGGVASAQGSEGRKGVLVAGAVADMTVFTRNPFVVGALDLPALEVGMTIVGGQVSRIV